MFYYISGKAEIVEPNLVVIDAGGVGYAVNTSLYTSSSVTRGQGVKLYTYLNVKEDVFELYGFSTNEELTLFKNLISISGVGVKAAVSILSVASTQQIAIAIISGDEKLITRASGIGKKIAQRVILELRDKMAKSKTGLEGIQSMPSGTVSASGGSAFEDAMEALEVLGYQRVYIMEALKGENMEGLGTEDIIRAALKKLM